MTEKRLFVGRKKCEDRFTIILDYDGEIGVKENRSGDVIVLNHRDLNSEQFVAQLVVFLNDQNQAIVDLYDGSKYWSDKATEKIKELEKENEQLKQELKKYKEPNCKKCIEYSQDGVADYCMSENGLLGRAWKSFPFEWDYTNAKDCKEYEE